MGIKTVTGNKYLGEFIRESKEEKICLARKVTGWADSVETLAGGFLQAPAVRICCTA